MDKVTLPLLSTLLAAALPAQRPNIMLTGYWPPSNEAVRHFSTDPLLNPGGWQGSDWESRGYDVHAFFPSFSPPTCTTCGAGTGQLTVDYQATSADFWPIANGVQPIAIITFSRGAAGVSWELEMNQFNRTTWENDYIPPLQPTPTPPDSSVPAGYLRLSQLPVQTIVNAILAAGLPVNPAICATGDGGGFLSEFIAYHGVWYQDIHRWPGDPAWCAAAGHVHIGQAVSWALARQAAEVTLRQVIAHVDAIRAATVCQGNIGFQGPGTALFEACGGALNVFGNIADMRVVGALPSTIGVLALGSQNNPTPLFGGSVVPVPTFYLNVLAFDANGTWLAPGALIAPPMPLPDVFAQVAWFDPAQPQGWGLSNALRLTLQ
ncbi:MAG TPA: hypothetical protein VFZ65_09390 [Planctomycetota bacterium]|nr:hypothetical protein [Planctomycetota bacterium]